MLASRFRPYHSLFYIFSHSDYCFEIEVTKKTVMFTDQRVCKCVHWVRFSVVCNIVQSCFLLIHWLLGLLMVSNTVDKEETQIWILFHRLFNWSVWCSRMIGNQQCSIHEGSFGRMVNVDIHFLINFDQEISVCQSFLH